MSRRMLATGWVLLIAAAFAVGTYLTSEGYDLLAPVPPLFTRWGLNLRPWLVVGVLLAAWVIVKSPRLPLWGWGLVAWVWGRSLDLELIRLRQSDYSKALERGPDNLAEFVRTYVASLDNYHVHATSHPPGTSVVIKALGLTQLGEFVLYTVSWSVAVMCVIALVRVIGTPGMANRVAPWVALSPIAAVSHVQADAFFAAAAAAGLLLMAKAGQRNNLGWGLAGGVVLGFALHLSYGLAVFGVIVLGVVRWRPKVLAGAAVGVAVVFGGFMLAGFNWLEGVDAARGFYYAGAGGRRPYGYFVWANFAACAAVTGPAVAIGLGKLRKIPTEVRWLVVSGLAAMLLASLSGLSKAETERIWLPFTLFVLPAAAYSGSLKRMGWVQVAWAVLLVSVTLI